MNATFVSKYRPLFSKRPDEYWITLEDFRCNFAGLVICSNEEPYFLEGFHVDRVYNCKRNLCIDSLHNNFVGGRHSSPALILRKEKKKAASKDVPEILVNEHRPLGSSKSVSVMLSKKDNDGFLQDCSPETLMQLLIRRGSLDPSIQLSDSDLSKFPDLSRMRAMSLANKQQLEEIENWFGQLKGDNSVSSILSGIESPFSTSDVSIDIRSREDSLSSIRNHLPLSSTGRKFSTGSVCHLTQSNFLATKTDCFRAHGSWKLLASQEEVWKSKSIICS